MKVKVIRKIPIFYYKRNRPHNNAAPGSVRSSFDNGVRINPIYGNQSSTLVHRQNIHTRFQTTTLPYETRPSKFRVFETEFLCRCTSPRTCPKPVHCRFEVSEPQFYNYLKTKKGEHITRTNKWAQRTRTLVKMCNPRHKNMFIDFLVTR